MSQADGESTMEAYTHWAGIPDSDRGRNLQTYVTNLADARFVIRRVLRLVNDHAKDLGLEPLTHQALLQIYGTNYGGGISVSALAKRLDIPSALASRLVRDLEQEGLVVREPSAKDRRVTTVSATREGIERLRDIDDSVHYDIIGFHRQLTDEQRLAALSIFAFYVGLDPASAAAQGMNINGVTTTN